MSSIIIFLLLESSSEQLHAAAASSRPASPPYRPPAAGSAYGIYACSASRGSESSLKIPPGSAAARSPPAAELHALHATAAALTCLIEA